MSIDLTATDTIAAIATPPGSGGVGIVRVSGPGALDAAKDVFQSSRRNFARFKPYVMHHGRVRDAGGAVLDEVLAVWMPGPGSYTGEDVVEFQGHGGPAAMRAVLEAVLAAGARGAEPGEFTYRAFRNARLDLTQAEAVAEVIAAPTRAGLSLAQARLSGALGRRVTQLSAGLEELRAGVCLAVDFPDDEVECLPLGEFKAKVLETLGVLEDLLETHRRSRCWREGALAVLAGQVNAGKSSLMNALLGRERAIVTDVPGTTRDYIEETLDLDGLAVRLTDTAGLRDTGDRVEQAGHRLSRELAGQADLVLLVLDGSKVLDPEDARLAGDQGPERVLAVCNKADLPRAESDPAKALSDLGLETVSVSAKAGTGLARLAKRIRTRILEKGKASEPDEIGLAPNLRQAKAVTAARDELAALVRDIDDDRPYDLLGVRLETACAHLSEITGEITPAAVLENVFSRFCIGK